MPHVDPVASIVGGLALMLLAAKLGGELAIRVKQPAVLGVVYGVALRVALEPLRMGLYGVFPIEVRTHAGDHVYAALLCGRATVAEEIATAEELGSVKLVYDLVYNPSETRLLSEAKAAGAKTLGGLEMLIAQGARQFEIWTGGEAPVKEMKAAIEERLK